MEVQGVRNMLIVFVVKVDKENNSEFHQTHKDPDKGRPYWHLNCGQGLHILSKFRNKKELIFELNKLVARVLSTWTQQNHQLLNLIELKTPPSSPISLR